ncbi:hypothetical protein CASFOL_009976 [Castilleja foliolosa]|uniref:CW-type domain-containing protein n=1 Tax=Castilleja foliolosa TaxID=1961234 RepID=A0ABD3DRA1_9LAMI
MISVGSRDGRKRIGLGLEMEETELEEGEALNYHHNEASDSTIDPDVALSYIGEKLQSVLGHFQKDFEGGVSAENLGAKFGGYGSFLPTHQRSPSWSHTRSPAEAHNYDSPKSPRKLHLEDQRQISVASSSASLKAVSVGNSLKVNNNNGNLKSRHAEIYKCGGFKKSINSSDQRTLKVRIKVGSESLPTQKNADIYSGLGLVVSPSSSLDDGPETSEGQFGKFTDVPEASPTSILQIMTSYPCELLLSPLSENLIHLTEKKKAKAKPETKAVEKINQKKSKSPLKDDIFSLEFKIHKNELDIDNNGSLLKGKETEIDSLGCEELVSNALKLPLLSSSQNTFSDLAKVKPIASNILDNKSKKGNNVSNIAAEVHSSEKSLALDQSESIVSRGRKVEENLKPALENSFKRKQKVAYSSNSDTQDLERDHEKKPGDRYKDVFGDFGFEDEDNESVSGEMTLKNPQLVGKRSLNDDHNTSKEKFNSKISEKPQVPENYPGHAASQSAHPVGNGPSSEAPIGSVPLVKEDWVSCDKCQKWRLLPLGTNLKSLPDKWLCWMLTWLPGMNRCSVPQEETTNALRALCHPTTLVPGSTSKNQQHSQLNNNNNNYVLNPAQMASVDARYPSQENQNNVLQTPTTSGKKKNGSTKASNSTDHDGSTISSNSRRKSLGTSGNKSSNMNSGKNSPSLDAIGHQHIRQSSSAVEKYGNQKKERLSLSNSSDKGVNLKIRSKLDSDMEGSRDSKRLKSEELHFDDDNWASDNGGTSSKAGRRSASLSNNTSGNDRLKYNSHKDLTEIKKDVVSSILGTSDDVSLFPEKRDDKKRKSKEEMYESDRRKDKKARVSKSGGKQYEHNNNTQAVDYLKSDMLGSVNPSVAANSSSSKVSGSHKNKINGQEVKGSPVESVSSSPLKYPRNADTVALLKKNPVGKEDIHDSGEDETDMVKKDDPVKFSSEQCKVVEEKVNINQSQKKKSGKGSSSHSELDLDKVHSSSRDSLDHEHLYMDKPKSRRNKSDEKSSTQSKGDKFIGKKEMLSESSKGKSQKKFGHDGQDVVKSQDKKLDSEKLPKKVNEAEVNGSGKSHSLPPLARTPTEKENGVKSSANEANGHGDAHKVPNPRKKSENSNGQPMRHPTPNSHKGRDVDAPSPGRRDSSSHAANSALKEAKDLKHLADRLKNSGSTESNGFYFQAALKFLHGASLLESGSSEAMKHNDLMHALHIYSSTAKLCEFCAHEYEKLKDMSTAALAYKCMEVAFLRVVYSSHASASRDRNELQTALQIVPPGESPSSSASDLDNLNHQAITDKAVLAKVVGSPQVSGSHVISSRNRAGFLRILNVAQDVSFAMEASRKSRIAFTAATSKLGDTSNKESIYSLKKALDFNFQDVEGLLRLVRIAVEDIRASVYYFQVGLMVLIKTCMVPYATDYLDPKIDTGGSPRS